MSEKQKFQEILSKIRADIKFLKKDLFDLLLSKLRRDQLQIDQDFKDWTFDVYLDKWYETDAKIRRIMNELGFNISSMSVSKIRQCAETLIFSNYLHPYQYNNNAEALRVSVEQYEAATEKALNFIRQSMYESNWDKLKKLRLEDYVIPYPRAKYVQARDELGKAKQAVKDAQWEEVLNHLRPAIDLAIKEKFGFRRINPMKQFLIEAERFDLGLPTYTMLYDYFDEGSQRIHSGKLNTPYECQNALEFVAGFIDRLDLIQVDQQKIDEFKQSCRCVE